MPGFRNPNTDMNEHHPTLKSRIDAIEAMRQQARADSNALTDGDLFAFPGDEQADIVWALIGVHRTIPGFRILLPADSDSIAGRLDVVIDEDFPLAPMTVRAGFPLFAHVENLKFGTWIGRLPTEAHERAFAVLTEHFRSIRAAVTGESPPERKFISDGGWTEESGWLWDDTPDYDECSEILALARAELNDRFEAADADRVDSTAASAKTPPTADAARYAPPVATETSVPRIERQWAWWQTGLAAAMVLIALGVGVFFALRKDPILPLPPGEPRHLVVAFGDAFVDPFARGFADRDGTRITTISNAKMSSETVVQHFAMVGEHSAVDSIVIGLSGTLVRDAETLRIMWQPEAAQPASIAWADWVVHCRSLPASAIVALSLRPFPRPDEWALLAEPGMRATILIDTEHRTDEKSALAWGVVEALDGWADANADGSVTTTEVAEYVQQRLWDISRGEISAIALQPSRAETEPVPVVGRVRPAPLQRLTIPAQLPADAGEIVAGVANGSVTVRRWEVVAGNQWERRDVSLKIGDTIFSGDLLTIKDSATVLMLTPNAVVPAWVATTTKAPGTRWPIRMLLADKPLQLPEWVPLLSDALETMREFSGRLPGPSLSGAAVVALHPRGAIANGRPTFRISRPADVPEVELQLIVDGEIQQRFRTAESDIAWPWPERELPDELVTWRAVPIVGGTPLDDRAGGSTVRLLPSRDRQLIYRLADRLIPDDPVVMVVVLIEMRAFSTALMLMLPRDLDAASETERRAIGHLAARMNLTGADLAALNESFRRRSATPLSQN